MTPYLCAAYLIQLFKNTTLKIYAEIINSHKRALPISFARLRKTPQKNEFKCPFGSSELNGIFIFLKSFMLLICHSQL